MVAPSGLALRSHATPASNIAPHPTALAAPTAALRTHASLARGSRPLIARDGAMNVEGGAADIVEVPIGADGELVVLMPTKR